MRFMLLAVALTGAMSLALTMTTQVTTVHAAATGKNLKIYPKGTEVAQLKKDMKLVAKAVGQKCDYCHNLDAMDQDTPMKGKARLMMKMLASINDSLKKEGFKSQVTCMTCHQGQKKPPKK